MASKNEAKVKFTADTKEFTAQVKAANSTLTTLRSELRLNKTEANATGDSIENLTDRQRILTSELDASQQKVTALSNKLDVARAAFGDTSPEVQKLETQLNNAMTAQTKMQQELDATNSALDGLRAASAQAESAMGRLETTVSNQESELSRLKSQYNNVAMEQGEASTEARELASRIQSLSTELQENKTKLDSASTAADKFDRSMDDAGDGAKDFENDLSMADVALANFAAELAGRALDAIADLSSEVMESSDAVDKFVSTMSFAGFDTSAIDKAKTNMKEYADQTVYDLNTVMNTTAQLAANGIPNYEGLTQAAGNLTAAAGGGADAFNSVAMMLTQTAGAGKLTTENWNQLADAIPGASGVLQQAMKDNGAYTGNFRDAMEKGEITADEFNQAIMDLGSQPVAVEAAKSTKTFEGALGNLQATAVNVGTSLIDSIGKDNITGAINAATDAVQFLNDHMSEILPVVGAAAGAFVAFKTAMSIGQIAQLAVGGITKMVSAVKGASGAMGVLNAVLGANPILKIVSLIAALVAAFIVLWNTSEDFRNFWLGLWDGIKQAASGFVDWASGAFASVGEFFTNLWDTISTGASDIWSSVQGAWQGFVDWIGGAFDTVVTTITGVWDTISTAAQTAWNFISSIVQVAVMLIGEIINGAVQILLIPWNFIWQNFGTTITNVWTAIQTFISTAITTVWNIIQTVLTTIQTVWNTIWTAISTVASTIWGGIQAFIQAEINGIQIIISTVLGVISSVWSTIWGTISSVATTIWNAISGTVSTVISTISGVISSVLSTISGIWSSVWGTVSSVASSIWNTIKTTISNAINGAKDTVSNVVNGIKNTITSVFNAAKSTVTNIFNSIKKAIETPINAARDAVKSAIDKIKGFFNFSWSLPKLKLPHISIKGEFSLMPPSVPHFGIEWYAKGGILNGPTIFGMNGGNAMVGGEAGPEAVAPLGDLLGYMIEAIDARFGQTDISPLVDAIEDLSDRVISIEIDGKQVARTTASHADRVNGSRQQLINRGVSLA